MDFILPQDLRAASRAGLVTNSIYCLGNPIQVPYSLGSENERRLTREG
jgi:hypothetical protein